MISQSSEFGQSRLQLNLWQHHRTQGFIVICNYVVFFGGLSLVRSHTEALFSQEILSCGTERGWGWGSLLAIYIKLWGSRHGRSLWRGSETEAVRSGVINRSYMISNTLQQPANIWKLDFIGFLVLLLLAFCVSDGVSTSSLWFLKFILQRLIEDSMNNEGNEEKDVIRCFLL